MHESKAVKNHSGERHRNGLQRRFLESNGTPHPVCPDRHPKRNACFHGDALHEAIAICSGCPVPAAPPWQSSPSTRSCTEALPDPITTLLCTITHTPDKQVLQAMTTELNCISWSLLSQLPGSQLRRDRLPAEQPFWSWATKIMKNPRTSHLCSQKQLGWHGKA